MADRTFLIADSIYCGVTRTYRVRQFNLHKSNAGNERPADGLHDGRWFLEISRQARCSLYSTSLGNKTKRDTAGCRAPNRNSIVVGNIILCSRRICAIHLPNQASFDVFLNFSLKTSKNNSRALPIYAGSILKIDIFVDFSLKTLKKKWFDAAIITNPARIADYFDVFLAFFQKTSKIEKQNLKIVESTDLP